MINYLKNTYTLSLLCFLFFGSIDITAQDKILTNNDIVFIDYPLIFVGFLLGLAWNEYYLIHQKYVSFDLEESDESQMLEP